MEKMTQEMDKLQKQNDSIFLDDAFDDSVLQEDDFLDKSEATVQPPSGESEEN